MNYKYEKVNITDLNKYIDKHIDRLYRTNISNCLNPLFKPFAQEQIKKYCKEYIKYIQPLKQRKKNTKDIEAYLFKIKLPSVLTTRENRRNKNLAKFIDILKEEIWVEKTTFIAHIEKKGKKSYLYLLILDRYFYPEGKVLKSGGHIYYYDPKNGRKCNKEKEGAIKKRTKVKEEIIYVSSKIRQDHIHYAPTKEKKEKRLTNFILYLRKKILLLVKQIINNKKTSNVFELKKLKKKKKLSSGKVISVHNKQNKYDLVEQYERRKVKNYNKVINIINFCSISDDFKNNYAFEYKNILESIKDIKIDDYEAKINDLVNDIMLFLEILKI